MSQGDALARGARSAVFPPAQVSQAKWDAIFAPEKKSGKHFKNGKAPAGTPAELIDPPTKNLKTNWSR